MKLQEHHMIEHSHGKGTMNITGVSNYATNDTSKYYTSASGAFKGGSITGNWPGGSGSWHCNRLDFNAKDSWTGNTSSFGSPKPTVFIPPFYSINMWIRIS